MSKNESGRIVQRLVWENGVTRLSSDRVDDVEAELEARGFTLLPGETDLLRCYVQTEEPAWFAVWIRLHDIEYLLSLPDQRSYEGWMRQYGPVLNIADRIFGKL